MVRFYGKVGYSTGTVEKAAGVWVDDMVEVEFFGDVVRNTRQLVSGSKVNDDITVGTSISIVADADSNGGIFAMRYVEWKGDKWIISEVDVQIPRLILRLGDIYNGPTP